jgi:hypothetical protein
MSEEVLDKRIKEFIKRRTKSYLSERYTKPSAKPICHDSRFYLGGYSDGIIRHRRTI